ncbi:transcription factor RelB [Myripristis murdjan]|uniref:V-rel avian reticuloendotheliosis viral oncogene homolog B n=1 Tax=Myripristis murdjan TaxID=586833 RepID=A0A667XMG4_9TELE|nr:transcription factor RelB [Myripristis murdjan]
MSYAAGNMSASEAMAFFELEIIQEVIAEGCQGTSGSSLPRPPPPPADLLCPPLNQNHRMPRQSSSPSSQPVLVARGTAPQGPSSSTQHVQTYSCSREMASANPGRGVSHSGSPRRGRSSSCLVSSRRPGSLSSTAQSDTDLLERVLEKPKLVVVEEPKERGMRFRYECEGRSAGSILGASSTETSKTQPAIEIQGPIEHIKKVTVTTSLVTKDFPYRPHPHCLVGKDCPEGSGICVVQLNPHNNRRHSFSNLGIQCVRRKELDSSLQKRRSQNIDPFRTGNSKSIEDMDMNVVRLCFQCELEWDDGRKDCLSPVVSNPVYDKKATTTSQLKISCLNIYKGPCTGKTEIFMLCDKIQKDDIEIIFKRGTWEAKGEFCQSDVHRQIAIVFRSPPYQDMDIAREVDVSIVLRRLSDRMDSEPVTFTYLPYNSDPYSLKRKRKIKSDISFRDRPCLAGQSAAAEEPSSSMSFLFSREGVLPAEDGLASAQPSVSTVGERNYSSGSNSSNSSNSSQDSDLPDLLSNPEELALFNRLLEMPSLWNMLNEPSIASSLVSSFDQGPDGNLMFPSFDLNFNPNFGQYGQDFSQYNDVQFNHLVNESQTPQPEPQPQDSPSHMVQVKTEDEP